MNTRKDLIRCILLIYICIFSTACGKEEKDARVFYPGNYVFNDGVAWVQQQYAGFFSPRYEDLICIDENGVEIFSMSDVTINDVSNFYNNMALIDGQYIINKSGEITHDLINELGVKIKMLPNNYFDGFIFVEKEINGVIMTGMLNEDLEWVIEPTSKFNDIESKDEFLYYSNSIGYYDALTNEFIDENKYKQLHLQRCFPKSGLLFLSYNGSRKFTYSNGTIKGTTVLEDSDKTGFYNKNLELVLDLSFYTSIKPLSDFQNEKCLIQFETEQEKLYIGLINIEGEFLFIHSDGFVKFNSEKIEFNDCYFDWSGNCYLKKDDE